MTTVYLALGGSPLDNRKNPTLHDDTPGQVPSVLISYFKPYRTMFARNRDLIRFRSWVMDSGAYTAFNSGVTIDLDAYIEHCQHALTTDPLLDHVFALDVIGDWRASIKNTERMWEAGVPAVPVYHLGEPVHVLKHLAETYPKIAIGGCAKERSSTKENFARYCFSKTWPKKIHGFGYGAERDIMAWPFHSVDATSWQTGPLMYGRYASFNGKLPIRGGLRNLKTEVMHYMRIERRAQGKWAREMQLLEE